MATDQSPSKNATLQPDLGRDLSSRCEDSTMLFVGDECDLVSDDLSTIFQVVNFVIIVQTLDLFGTVTNMINIICFVKQGLKDSSNVSLLGLAISDMLSMATLIWANLCLTPVFYRADIPFDAEYISYLTSGVHHNAFTRIGCWITAFITLERCLCIAHPLKVKRILTSKTAIIINTTIYTVVYCGNICPVFYTARFAMIPHPRKPNTTWLGIAFTEDLLSVDTYSNAINNCFLPFSAFVIISLLTVVLVVKLKDKTKWRNESTAPGKSSSISNRDQAVSNIVVTISTMFIVSYFPICIMYIGMVAVPEFSISGRYKNLATVVVSFSYIFESLNASFNIFFYYKMSSRYRQTFRQIFCTFRGRDSGKQFKKRR